MFYVNLGFIVHLALVLLILSNFNFLSIGQFLQKIFVLPLCNFFSKIACFSELYRSMQSFSVIDLFGIAYEQISNSAHA